MSMRFGLAARQPSDSRKAGGMGTASRKEPFLQIIINKVQKSATDKGLKQAKVRRHGSKERVAQEKANHSTQRDVDENNHGHAAAVAFVEIFPKEHFKEHAVQKDTDAQLFGMMVGGAD